MKGKKRNLANFNETSLKIEIDEILIYVNE